MKKLSFKTVLAVLFLLVHYSGFSQTDTTIFTSSFEQKILLKLANSEKADELDIALAFDYNQPVSEGIRKRMEMIKIEFDKKLAEQKNQTKKVKLISNYLQENFFKKYDGKAFFNDLFSIGSYNYVSAAMLYTLFFKNYGVEYEIKEAPEQIIILAGPADNRVMVGEPIPKMAMLEFNEKVKTDYLNYYADIKVISIEKIKNSSLDKLFKEYYDDYNLNNMLQLAALQYRNKAIFKYSENEYTEAINSLEKANLINPLRSNKFLMNALLASKLGEENNQKKFEAKYLAKYVNLNSKDPEAINNADDFFKVVSNELIFTSPQKEKYVNYYSTFTSLVDDSIAIDNFVDNYHYFMAYNEYVFSNFRQSLFHLNQSYIVNPDNVLTKGLVEEVGRKHFFTDMKHESTIDSLEAYFEIFPFMFQDKLYQQYYSYCFMHIISKCFRNNDVVKGNKYLVRFSNVMSENPDWVFDESHVEGAFADIAIYYMKNNKMKEAMKYIKKGQEIVPDAYSLKRLEGEINTITNYKVKPYEYAPVKPAKDDYEERFTKMMDNRCFVSTTYTKDNVTTPVPDNEKIKISSVDDKKITYTYKNKTEKGKWAIRPKIKLFYLIPDSNKDEYITFKIVDFDGKTFKLRVYETDKSKQVIKLNKNVIEFKICN